MRLNLSPASQVRSIVEPVRKLRSFIRTIAPPRPIFTCCQSSTLHGCPSNSMVTPFLRSPVDIIFQISLHLNHPAKLLRERKRGFCGDAPHTPRQRTPSSALLFSAPRTPLHLSRNHQ